MYTFGNYYIGRELVVGNIVALAPANLERTAQLIESKVSSTADVALVHQLLRSEQERAKLLHQGWLEHAQSEQVLLRNQLILWLASLGTSLLALVALHWKRRAL
jgi:hypothetical protein